MAAEKSRAYRAAGKAKLAAANPTKLRIVPRPAVFDEPAAPVSSSFTPVTVTTDAKLTPTQLATVKQIARIDDAADDHPALIALALRLAAVVDTAEVRDAITAAKELRAILAAMKPVAAAAPTLRSAQDEFLLSMAGPL